MQLTKHQKTIIASQCVGMIGTNLFTSGVLLSYSQALGFSSSTILILLAIPELTGTLLILSFAYYTPRLGIKIFGSLGIILGILGFFLLIGAAYAPASRLYFAFTGVSLIGIGSAMFNCGWLALLTPLIEKGSRGRFLGIMRFFWQLVSIGFSFVALSIIKSADNSNMAYTIILSIVIFLQVIRLITYNKIPDKTEKEIIKNKMSHAIIEVIKTPVFMSYCCYLFFLTLFTAACPWIINLEQSKYLGFSESQIIFVNTLFFFGNLIGFWLGGFITDKHGTKPVFIMAHFSFGIILFLFVGRDLLFVPPIYSHSILMLAFGIVTAASSIAITTELMNVIPLNNALISTSFYVVVLSSSKFLGAFVSSQALKLNLLTENWSIGPLHMNCYDTMLIGNAVMVILLVMTLGLIPSVSKQIHQS
jgi:MFS family permease